MIKEKVISVLDALQTNFLKTIGDIKYHPWPLFFIYDPKGFQVKGYEVREVINQVQPGDILLRGYDKYLSGLFIPGYFSHAALYVGEVKENDFLKLIQQIKPEKNSIIDKFKILKVEAKNAFETQSLLELKNNYCAKKRCLQCAIGNVILNKA